MTTKEELMETVKIWMEVALLQKKHEAEMSREKELEDELWANDPQEWGRVYGGVDLW